MTNEFERLSLLNARIIDAESQGDVAFFDGLLAPVFSFRRANGSIVDRSSFLAQVNPSPERESLLLAIDLLSVHRAIVSSVVTLMPDSITNTAAQRFHNVRLFVRASSGESWKLLAWANEPVVNGGRANLPADHLFGREIGHDLGLWTYHASVGGDDKSKMVTIASWLLGISAALLAYNANTGAGSTPSDGSEWVRTVVAGLAGSALSLVAAYVSVLYGGYANRNWDVADRIAWRRGWLDLLPDGQVSPMTHIGRTGSSSQEAGENGRGGRIRESLKRIREFLRRIRKSLNRMALRFARPTDPARFLAPVFETFVLLALVVLC